MLTARQEAFAQHYAASGKAADSARKAGYSTRAAKEIGCRLLTYDHVCRRVEELKAERYTKVVANAQETLREISALALAAIDSADPLAPARLRAKLGALLALAKHHGLFDGPFGNSDPSATNARLAELADSLQSAHGKAYDY